MERLHQEDFYQATGALPQHKYEAEGGPGLATCANVLRSHSALPIADLQLLVRWAAFNYLIGNEDAHGRNLALLYTADGLRLAPFYDLVSSAVYKGLSRNAAMGIGGERRHAYVQRRHWDGLADALRVPGAVVRRALEQTAGDIEEVLEETTEAVTARAGEVALLREVQAGVTRRIERLRDELPR